MPDKLSKIPGPEHPITIEASDAHVVVRVGDTVIADTHAALILQEANYSAVRYIPREDVEMTALQRTETQTHCPYKGDASYFSIPAGGERSVDAVWSYETPQDAVRQIGGYLAFYPDRVDSISVDA